MLIKYIVALFGMLLVVLLATPPAAASLNNDLYGYWSFDDDTVTDISGNGHDGTIFGGASYISSCQIGRCVQINAIGEGINISNLANFDGDVTFAGWIAVSSVNQYYVYANNPGPNTLLSLEQEGGTPRTDIMVYDGTAWRNTSASVSTGAWRHLVYLFNSSNNQIHMYVDGVKTGTPVAYDGNVTLQNLYVGAWDTPGNAVQFQGIADDMGIWNRTLTQQEITNLYNNVTPTSGNQLLITASDANSGSPISTFNATFSNGSFYSTTDGNITLINWTNGNYTVTVRSINYVSVTESINHLNQTILNIDMVLNNRVYLNFYNEQTREPIKNVTYYLRSDDYSDNRSVNTGRYNYSGLPAGAYEIRYGLDNATIESPYDPRSYYFLVPFTSTNTNLSLYLANETLTTTFLPTVVNQDYSAIVDSYISALRYYPSINQYLTVEMGEPDQQQGQTIMNLFFNTVPYKFRVYQNNTLLYEDETARYLADQTLTFTINTEGLLSVPFSACEGLQSNLTYINSTSTFRWQYNDADNNFDRYCLSVEYRYGIQENTTTSCSINPSSTILITVNGSAPGGHAAAARAFTNTFTCLASTATRERSPGVASFGLFGVLIGLLALIISFTVALNNPVIGIFMGIGALFGLAGTFLGITAISIVWLSTLLIIGIVIAFITRT